MVCFMVIEENIEEGNVIVLNDANPSYDDLLCATKEIHYDMQKLLKRNTSKNECSCPSERNKNLSYENE